MQQILQGHAFSGVGKDSTGTLYGRGTYFAESITKADEQHGQFQSWGNAWPSAAEQCKPRYAKAADGEYAMLLVRALGGRVRYCNSPNVAGSADQAARAFVRADKLLSLGNSHALAAKAPVQSSCKPQLAEGTHQANSAELLTIP